MSELLSQMVESLRAFDVDLGDERDVIRKLIAAGFRSHDVSDLIDCAIERTRALGQKLNFGG
ncbi:MAG: hypothetical protein WA418_38685 [Bradyrhizobium sp.]